MGGDFILVLSVFNTVHICHVVSTISLVWFSAAIHRQVEFYLK